LLGTSAIVRACRCAANGRIRTRERVKGHAKPSRGKSQLPPRVSPNRRTTWQKPKMLSRKNRKRKLKGKPSRNLRTGPRARSGDERISPRAWFIFIRPSTTRSLRLRITKVTLSRGQVPEAWVSKARAKGPRLRPSRPRIARPKRRWIMDFEVFRSLSEVLVRGENRHCERFSQRVSTSA